MKKTVVKICTKVIFYSSLKLSLIIPCKQRLGYIGITLSVCLSTYRYFVLWQLLLNYSMDFKETLHEHKVQYADMKIGRHFILAHSLVRKSMWGQANIFVCLVPNFHRKFCYKSYFPLYRCDFPQFLIKILWPVLCLI